MSTGEKGSATTKTPADFLKSIRGRPVVVKLNSGVDYRGQSSDFFVFYLCFLTFPLFSSSLNLRINCKDNHSIRSADWYYFHDLYP